MAAADPQTDHRRTRVCRAVVCLGAVVIGVGFVWLNDNFSRAIAIPNIDPDGVHPEVASGIESARSLVRDDPDSGEMWGNLGLTLWAHEYHPEARTCFREATRLDVQEFRWPYFLGHLLYTTDRKAARVALEEAVHRAPAQLLPRVRLAESLLDTGDAAAAQEQLQTALQISPEHPRVHLRLAQCLNHLNDQESALRHARQAQRQAPDHPGVLMLVGRLLLESGQQADAERTLTRLKRLTTREANWPDALVSQKQHFRLDPYWRALRAQQLINQGDALTGLGLLQQLVDRHPEADVLRTQLIRAFLSAGQIDEARSILSKSPQSHEDGFVYQSLRAVIHLLSSEWDAAETIYRDLLRHKPDSVGMLIDLAFVLRQRERYDQAFDLVDQALVLAPDNVAARVERVRTLIALDRVNEWRQAFAALQQLAPDSQDLQKLASELPDDNQP